MRANREGTMPAPDQHITIRVEIWRFSIEVEYTARPCDLVAAGITTPYMVEKILSGKCGARCDENGLKFRVRSGSITQKDAWNSGEPVTVLRRARTTDQALGLPGVRELYPEGITFSDANGKAREKAAPTADGLKMKSARAIGRRQRLAQWATIENVIWPNWRYILGMRAEPAPL